MRSENSEDPQQIANTLYPPIVFVADRVDVQSFRPGPQGRAVDFLTKPITQRELMKAIDAAIEQDRNRDAVRTPVPEDQARRSSSVIVAPASCRESRGQIPTR
jgi:FixJ family two-component response regulator